MRTRMIFEDEGRRIILEPAADDPIAAAEGALTEELGGIDVKRPRRAAREPIELPEQG